MASSTWAIQQLIYGILNNDATLKAAVTGIFDMMVPESLTPALPYVVVGEKMEVPLNRLTGIGRGVLLNIHVWSKYRGSKEVASIGSRIIALLENTRPSMSGWVVNSITLEGFDILDDGFDVQHGIVRIRVRVQPS